MTKDTHRPQADTPLWIPAPKKAQESGMAKFLRFAKERTGQSFQDYDELYQWSISDIEAFWAAIWDYSKMIHSRSYERVIDDPAKMPGAKWFEGAKLNFAENLLRHRNDKEALIFRNEAGERYALTYNELYAMVAKLAAGLKKLGVVAGDRVAGYVANIPEAVAAMLAATSLGAIWTSGSPDFGTKAALDRFGQTKPKVLFATDGYFYGGKSFDRLERVQTLCEEIDAIEHVIVIPFMNKTPDLSGLKSASLFGDVLKDNEAVGEIDFAQTEAMHPVYILYSSGTTGKPKCITHGAVGTLLQHYKELALHSNVTEDSTVFYFTTCGWMMWNWLVSTLMLGAKVVLFDGSPFSPGSEVLWKMAEEEQVTLFGTSAKYLAALEDFGYKPKEHHDLSSIEVICSTGSPLAERSFHFVYREIKKDVQLSSIAGGTDIVSCFVLGNPLLPVYAEEIQCRGLGMKVQAFDEDGQPLESGRGELVCAAPAPSMPIYFFNDPDMEKYKAAYFSVYPGIWRHGDYIELTEHGGVIMHGRSDATLNPGGVRIGTSEIYKPLETIAEVADSVVVGQRFDDDERVILFVKLAEGVTLDDALVKNIKTTIRNFASPRHVPAKILTVDDVPYTRTGKKVEMAVRQIIHGEEAKNASALSNPESLENFKNREELKC